MFLPQREKASLSENEAGIPDASIVITLKKLEYPEKADSLLKALGYYGILLEYQCRSGYCSSCRCQ